MHAKGIGPNRVEAALAGMIFAVPGDNHKGGGGGVVGAGQGRVCCWWSFRWPFNIIDTENDGH